MNEKRPTAYEIWAYSEGIKEKPITGDPLSWVVSWVAIGITAFGAALFSPLILLNEVRKKKAWAAYQDALATGDDDLIESTHNAWARACGIRIPSTGD